MADNTNRRPHGPHEAALRRPPVLAPSVTAGADQEARQGDQAGSSTTEHRFAAAALALPPQQQQLPATKGGGTRAGWSEAEAKEEAEAAAARSSRQPLFQCSQLFGEGRRPKEKPAATEAAAAEQAQASHDASGEAEAAKETAAAAEVEPGKDARGRPTAETITNRMMDIVAGLPPRKAAGEDGIKMRHYEQHPRSSPGRSQR